MITYTFKCANEHVQEVEYKMSEKPNTIHCDQCEHIAETVLQVSPFILKGSGWYKP